MCQPISMAIKDSMDPLQIAHKSANGGAIDNMADPLRLRAAMQPQVAPAATQTKRIASDIDSSADTLSGRLDSSRKKSVLESGDDSATASTSNVLATGRKA